MLNFEDNLRINQWVQSVIPFTDLIDQVLVDKNQASSHLLQELVDLCRQARCVAEDGPRAVAVSELNQRRSACVMLSKGASLQVLRKVAQLRGRDSLDALLLLLHVLRLADSRRRREEELPCSHWWHRDLGDPAVVAQLREQYVSGRLRVRQTP